MKRPAIDQVWMTTVEAGVYTGTNRRTVFRWIQEGLRHARISARAIRINKHDLDEWMERFVDKDADIDAQLERARVATNKKLRSMGLGERMKIRRKEKAS